MPAESDEPLRRTTLNLFASDVEWMEKKYGRGWTEKVRELVRDHKHKKDNPLMQLGLDGIVREVR